MIKSISVIVCLIFLSGCSSKKIQSRFVNVDNTQASHLNQTNNPNHFRYKPVIGTRQDDTKVMIDMGKFAKIWIKNYRNKNQTFVASHDIITMIEAPGFIAGEDIPSSKRSVQKKTYGGNTFSYRSSDLIHTNSMDQSELKTSQIKDFVNNYKTTEKYKKLPEEKQKQLGKYDEKIKYFLNNKREEKEDD